MSEHRPINVVIPMAGQGSRFKQEGYTVPKPLINILGRPMISWVIGNLHFKKGDKLFIGYLKDQEATYNFEQIIHHEFPAVNKQFIQLKQPTTGAAATLLAILQEMSEEELRRPTISLDCDTIYFSDVIDRFQGLEPEHGCCFYFIDSGNVPMYSYIKTAKGGERICSIAEKVKISEKANTGAYGFSTGLKAIEHIKRLLNMPLPAIGEYYISAVIAEMLKDGMLFDGVFTPDFNCVGTPQQVREFIAYAKHRVEKVDCKRPIVIELQNALESSSFAELMEALPCTALAAISSLRRKGLKIKFCFSRKDHYVANIQSKDLIDWTERDIGYKRGYIFKLDEDLMMHLGW